MADADLQALWLTLKLAAVSTLLLLALGGPLAWWLARTRARWASLIESLVALPLVLPPTVLGFYLLLMLRPGGWPGLDGLAFSFGGLVLGSVIYSLPFAVQPLRQAFAAVPQELLDAGATAGAGPLARFFELVIPLSRPGIVSAASLAFAHTLGEFGVVLMIGGSIPGETRVLSIALFEHAEALDFVAAHQLAAILLIGSWLLLIPSYAWARRQVP